LTHACAATRSALVVSHSDVKPSRDVSNALNQQLLRVRPGPWTK
jgi:hypothetical protein